MGAVALYDANDQGKGKGAPTGAPPFPIFACALSVTTLRAWHRLR